MPDQLVEIATYLQNLYGGKPVRIVAVTRGTDKQESADDLKGFGYGTPLFLEYDVGGEHKKAVLETMAPSSYGHDHFSDRAQAILWEHASFNNLPRHVHTIDAGAFLDSGSLVSCGNTQEFFLLTEFVNGTGYYKDLERIRDEQRAEPGDMNRVLALSDYLVQIHSLKHRSPELYTRRIRELIGHGECIMGIIDNYPQSYEIIGRELLHRIETTCVEWRWRIKDRSQRLCQVHGDFHPWNILFRNDTDFTVLDRSRGEWGEPADDLATITINYLFFSLQQSETIGGIFEEMFLAFWQNYISKTGDRDMLEVVAPFYAWRGLVIASPVWYPKLSNTIRMKLVQFIINVLNDKRFNPENIRGYIE